MAMTSWVESTPGDAAPGSTDVHVWRFRRQTIAADVALREILAAYAGTDPRKIEITTGPRGKPALASPLSGLHFNVSHSGDWVVVAIARVEVGIDVEQIRPQRASARLADRFLTAGERALIDARAASQGEAAFFIVWSRKEAYLKAIGVGLSVPFSGVDSSADRLPDLDASGRQQAGDEPWTVREFFVDELHPAAVVARSAHFSLSLFTLTRAPA